MCLNDDQLKQQTVFSLCLEALKRMDQELVLNKNVKQVNIYKDPNVSLYPHDKIEEVLDENDSITIVLSMFRAIVVKLLQQKN